MGWGLVRFHPNRYDEVAFDHGLQPITARALNAHDALAVVRHERIQVDESMDTIGHAISHARYYHAAITVAHENDVMKIFIETCVDYIINVRAESDVRPTEMHTFTQSGELRSVDVKPFLPEQFLDTTKGPTATPCAMDDYDSRFCGCVWLCSLGIE